MQTKLKKGDVITVALCLCAALVLFALPFVRSDAQRATLAVTYRDGTEQVFTLGRDQVLTLYGGSHTLTVVIENGTARVSESDCPDGLCRTGRISRDGEALVCLPAGIVLTVKSGRGGDVDAIVG